MAWVKIDDQAPRNAKLLRAGPAAAWLWVCGIAHCQAHLSEGFIADVALSMIGVRGAGRARELADRLVACALFDRVDGGYIVHDYLDFNETREEALARKTSLAAKRSVSGRAGGIASGVARSNEANRKQRIEAKRSPDPTRPDLKEPPNPLSAKGGITKRELREAGKIRAKRFGRCTHDPAHALVDDCLKFIVFYELRVKAS